MVQVLLVCVLRIQLICLVFILRMDCQIRQVLIWVRIVQLSLQERHQIIYHQTFLMRDQLVHQCKFRGQVKLIKSLDFYVQAIYLIRLLYVFQRILLRKDFIQFVLYLLKEFDQYTSQRMIAILNLHNLTTSQFTSKVMILEMSQT